MVTRKDILIAVSALAALWLLGFHCSTVNTPGQTRDTTPKVVATDTIGPEGGTIGTSNASFTFAPNTLAGTSTLELIEQDTSVFASGQAGKVYSLKGLPDGFTGNIRIGLKYSGTLANESFVANLVPGINHNTRDTVLTAPVYFAATDSAGCLVATLTFGDSLLKKTRGALWREPVKVTAVTNEKVITSDHFKIFYSTKDFSSLKASVLSTCLEDAWKKFDTLGFGIAAMGYTNKLCVYVNSLGAGSSDYGFYNRAFPWFSPKWGYIQINSDKVTSDDDIKETCVHEFFHYVHDIYKCDDYSYWLQDALSTWSEELLLANPATYLPSTTHTHFNRPFHGLQAGEEWNDPIAPSTRASTRKQNHGYGMGSFVKYVVQQSTLPDKRKVTKTILDSIQAGSRPINAIRSTISTDFGQFVGDYFNAFMLNQIYRMDRFALTSSLADFQKYLINTVSDTARTVGLAMPDYSASVLQITPSGTFPDTQSLKLSLTTTGDAADFKYYVYTYSDAAKTYPQLAVRGVFGASIVKIDSISQYQKANKKMLIMIVNTRGTAPFTGSTNCSVHYTLNEPPLSMLERMKKSKAFYFNFYMPVVNRWTTVSYTGVLDTHWNQSDYQEYVSYSIPEDTSMGISWSGTTFTVKKEELGRLSGYNRAYRDTMDVNCSGTFSADGSILESFTLSSIGQYTSSIATWTLDTISFAFGGITGTNDLKFRLLGDTTKLKTAITAFSYRALASGQAGTYFDSVATLRMDSTLTQGQGIILEFR